MGNGSGRLQKDEALLRIRQIDAAPFLGLHDHSEVCLGVIAEQRQFEAILSGNGAVAGRAVATLLREYREQVLAEVDTHLRRIRCHAHCNQRRLALQLRLDDSLPWRNPTHRAILAYLRNSR